MLDIHTVSRIAAVASLTVLGACTSTGSGETNTLQNLLMYGGTTAPPIAPTASIEVADCPPVTVAEGGAAIRAVTGSGVEGVRSQVSIANVARECSGRPDGSVVVKVGVQGRALLGPGGGNGRFDTPVTIVLKHGDQVVARRVARGGVTIPPGRYEESFVVVEDGLVVPAGTGEFDIEVSLGSGGGAARPARTRRARG